MGNRRMSHMQTCVRNGGGVVMCGGPWLNALAGGATRGLCSNALATEHDDSGAFVTNVHPTHGVLPRSAGLKE